MSAPMRNNVLHLLLPRRTEAYTALLSRHRDSSAPPESAAVQRMRRYDGIAKYAPPFTPQRVAFAFAFGLNWRGSVSPGGDGGGGPCGVEATPPSHQRLSGEGCHLGKVIQTHCQGTFCASRRIITNFRAQKRAQNLGQFVLLRRPQGSQI